jgi:hypothetical protein
MSEEVTRVVAEVMTHLERDDGRRSERERRIAEWWRPGRGTTNEAGHDVCDHAGGGSALHRCR